MGGVSITDMSRSPNNDICSVRGIGVALMADHVHALLELLQPLLVLDAEALLLVHDHQPEILEIHVLRQQPVRADGDIDFAFRQIGEDALSSLALRNRLSISTRTGNGWKRRLNVSKCWNARTVVGARTHDLLAVAQRLERRAHDHFRLAEAHVAAQQPVHGLRILHVALDLLDGGELVFRFGEFEGVFELALPVAVGGKTETFGHLRWA